MPDEAGETISFGPFEWDPGRAELRRHGVRIKLTGQPLEVLTALLDDAGRLVTREQLRRKLWADDVYVDVDQGLNTAVARLRQALGDSAENPRYIETVPGRGYRFVAPVALGSTDGNQPGRAPGLDRRTWLAGALGLVIGGAGTFWALRTVARAPRSTATSPGRAPLRFVVSGPPGPRIDATSGFADVALSPDGRRIAYRANVGGASRVFARSLDSATGALAVDRDAFGPFFSPDGDEIGYYHFTERALKRASVSGGPGVTVAPLSGMLCGASWTAAGQIVLGTLDVSTGLQSIPATGGDLEQMTTPAPGTNHVLPDVLPDGRAVLFTIFDVDDPGSARLAVLDTRSGRYTTLVRGSHARYAGSGQIVFLRDDALMIASFDPDRLELVGEPRAALHGIGTARGALVPTAQYALSRDGSLLMVMGGDRERRQLVWVDRAGHEEALPAPIRGYTYPRVAPDGRWIALNMRDASGGETLLWDEARADWTPLTVDHGVSLYPVWKPNSQEVVYESGLPREINLYVKPVGGGDAGTLISSGPSSELRALYFVTPSGKELVFALQGDSGHAELHVMPLVAGAASTKLVDHARNADLSPDGRFLTYQSEDSGRFEIYLRSFPDVEERLTKLSTDGGVQPVFSPIGDELFYLEPGPSPRLMRVELSTDGAPSRPQALLEWPYYTAALGRTYDVSRPDGRRFLAIKPVTDSGDDAPSGQAEIILNWLTQLPPSAD